MIKIVLVFYYRLLMPYPTQQAADYFALYFSFNFYVKNEVQQGNQIYPELELQRWKTN